MSASEGEARAGEESGLGLLFPRGICELPAAPEFHVVAAHVKAITPSG
jgi:hypothetical protein